MSRVRIRSGCVTLLSSIFVAPLVYGFDLPEDLPARSDGLWRIERTETLAQENMGLEMRKVWHVCLDKKADRDLHALEIYEQQASVVKLGEICAAPEFDVAGNSFSWGMQCTAPEQHGTRTSQIRQLATAQADDRMQAETTITNHNGLSQGEGRFAARMERVGACVDQQPGDMLLMHWSINGEETLKAQQRRTVAGEIEDYKARIAAGRSH